MLREAQGLSERRACGLVGMEWTSCRYQPRRREVEGLRGRLKSLAAERRRFGYRRLIPLCGIAAGVQPGAAARSVRDGRAGPALPSQSASLSSSPGGVGIPGGLAGEASQYPGLLGQRPAPLLRLGGLSGATRLPGKLRGEAVGALSAHGGEGNRYFGGENHRSGPPRPSPPPVKDVLIHGVNHVLTQNIHRSAPTSPLTLKADFAELG